MGMRGCMPSVSRGHHLVIWRFCLCSGHVPPRECLSASRPCPALPCSSCSILQCSCNGTYCATIWACLFAYSQVMPRGCAGRQCGRIYSCAYCVPVMPLGGRSIPDCMPSLFKQHHMAEWAHPLHTCMS